MGPFNAFVSRTESLFFTGTALSRLLTSVMSSHGTVTRTTSWVALSLRPPQFHTDALHSSQIHVRDLNYGCQHYDNLIARLSSLLRPGGVIILNEPEMAWWEFDDKVDPW
jgi:hypothetical protein